MDEGKSVLGEVSRLLEGQAADRELLARFVATRDGGAFAALLDRHGPMVMGVCQRILRDADAEDAFQATFLVLARRAAALRADESLGPWLYVVARRVALRLRADRMKRAERERQAAARGEQAMALADDLREVLDEEVGRLPPRYRSPVVLCYFQGKSNTEAAEELGCSKGTVSGRLARARDILRRRLSRRGVTLTSAGLVAVLTPTALNAAVPATLAAATLDGVLTGGAGTAAVLANGVLRAVRIKGWLTLLALCVSAVGIGMSLWAYLSRVKADPDEPARTAEPDPTKRPRRWQEHLSLNVGAPGQVHAVVIAPDGSLLAVALQQGGVQLWDARTGKSLGRPIVRDNAVLALGFSANGSTLTAVTAPNSVLAWDVQKQKLIRETSLGEVFLTSAILSRDGSTVAGITSDFLAGAVGQPPRQKALGLWDARTGKEIHGLTGHAQVTSQLALSPDGQTLASAGIRPPAQPSEVNGTPLGGMMIEVKLHELAGEKQRLLPEGGMSVHFSPDGSLLAFGSVNAETGTPRIVLWDVKASKPRRMIEPAGDAVNELLFSPDGGSLAAAGNDQTVNVWDVNTGRRRAALAGHRALISALAFSKDGDTLASADWSGAVRLWRLGE